MKEGSNMEKQLEKLIGLAENDEAKTILEAMPNIDIQDDNGNTPLMYAVSQCNYEMVKYLISKGANVNKKNNAGETPLHLASGYSYMGVCGYDGRKSILKALIYNMADINAKDNDGNTPLHCATFKMHHELVDIILEYGGDCTLTNNNGMKALDFAILKQDNCCVSLLQERCIGNKQLKSNIHIGIPSVVSFKNLVNYLMNSIFQRVRQDEKQEIFNMISRNSLLEGDTLCRIALNHAVFENKTEIANSILRRKDVNDMDEYGNTLLHFAVYKNNEKLVRRLIKMGARIDIKNKNGNTPLHLACLLNRSNIVQKLALRSNIRVLNILNQNNKTAFDIANEKGYKLAKAYITDQNNQNVVKNIMGGKLPKTRT